MFPGPHAQVYYNDAGEPVGWDYPPDEPYDDTDNYETDMDARDARAEARAEQLADEHADGQHEGDPHNDCDDCNNDTGEEETDGR